jgi:hypothetical protein
MTPRHDFSLIPPRVARIPTRAPKPAGAAGRPRPLLAGRDLLLEVGAIDPEVDLDGVAGRGVILAGVALLVLGGDLRHLGGRRRGVAAGQVGGDQLGLLLGEIDQGRQGLGQAHVEEVGHAGLHHPLEQRQAMVGVGDQGRIVQEREADLVAGGEDDHVHGLDAVVGEADVAALQRLDRRLEGDVAAAGPGQELAADRGVGLQRLVVGLGQAVVLHLAHVLADQRADDLQAQPARHPGRHGRLVRRLAVQIFREHPDPAPGRDDQLAGDRALGQLAGDIHGRIAHADHHHGLAAHVDRIERVAIGVGVEGGAVEGSRILRDARVPVVAVGDDQHVVEPGLAGRQGHRPQAVLGALGAQDLGVEGDGLAQAEMGDIGLEVGQDLAVVREVGPVGRDREVLEGQPPLRGVDVQALVAGRQAVGVLVVPVAADVVGGLEAVIGDAGVLQPLGGGEAAAARADDADLRQGEWGCRGHRLLPDLSLFR